MSMRACQMTCCVCLGATLKLENLSASDVNQVTLCTKLQVCVSEVNWSISYKICEQCSKLLDICYTFRETCLRSELIRQNTICVSDIVAVKEDLEKAEVFHVFTNTIPKKEEADESEYIKNETTDEERVDQDSEDDRYSSDRDEKPEDGMYQPKRRRKRKKSKFSCEKCENTYNSSIKLIGHCVREHGMNKLDIRPFNCDRCPSRFCNSSNLLQHIKYHDAVRSNMCTYCGKGFITKTDLNIHEKQHLNKREYRCDECGKCFNTHKDIRSHKLVVHTDSNCWKYCCEICNKPFPIKSNYDSHMRRHTGDKKFECHLCQRKFTDKCVLQRHMRTHSNVREYECPHCEREYKDPRVLKVHMAKVHGIGLGQIKIPAREKKYICHICPKSYYAKNKLTRHLYTHSGEKPFECPICGKKFNDKSYVKQHLRKTHNLMEDDVKQESNNERLTVNGGVLSGPEAKVTF